MTDEQIKKLDEFPGYGVTDAGDVFSFKNSQTLKPRKMHKGYLVVTLYRPGEKRRCVRVHKLVAEAFIGPCPKGMQIDHIDGDKTNNSACNLNYCTPRENSRRHASNKRGDMVGVSWVTSKRKWLADISVNQKKYSLGHYDDLDLAKAARKQAEVFIENQNMDMASKFRSIRQALTKIDKGNRAILERGER